MSNAATSWASGLEGLPVGAKLVLMLLSECHNGKTGQCNPKIEWLCKKTGYKSRMVARHLAYLEECGLLERETTSLGRARGKETAFILKIGRSADDLQLHHDTPVSEYTCTPVPLQVHSSTVNNKEEPENNRKYKPEKSGKDALDEIWPHWSAIGRKRSDSKSKLSDRLKRMAKTCDLDELVRGCIKYAKATNPEYHKGLQVFLKSGAWENWIIEQQTLDQPSAPNDWEAITASYREHGLWPKTLGPAPHEAGCQLELQKLKAIAQRLQGHRWHPRIIRNIEINSEIKLAS